MNRKMLTIRPLDCLHGIIEKRGIMRPFYLIFIILLSICSASVAQVHSVARKWNEVLLEAIRHDYARPTIHARNLFHVSAAIYDAWAAFEPNAAPFFLGNSVGGFKIPFDGLPFDPVNKQALQEEAISYAAYNLMVHRFQDSPGFVKLKPLMDSLHTALGYDINFTSTDFSNGSAASLGVYIAEQIELFGLQDGSNERGSYSNLYYEPVNEPLDLTAGGDNYLTDPDRWQPLQFGESFIDQSGNVVKTGVIDFLGAEWGNVVPFSLNESSKSTHTLDGNTYITYYDPGPPALIDTISGASIADPYKWGFSLVSVWSSHLGTDDGVTMDISPASIGNLDINDFPDNFSDFPEFYNMLGGGDNSTGYSTNPKTNKPYLPQIVPRGDYARVLAEFWADGPNSETPPGHWFVILNYVNDHPKFVRKFEGRGDVIDPLEWDVKAYFILGGTLHDVAIASWGVKGYYDYVRPISAIRYMATMGQCSDPGLPRYNRAGIPLIDGYIELVEEGDPLAGVSNEHVNEIKILAWKGHTAILNMESDVAGVGWILAKDWWPYQRPSFVTPPFAGYVSGHSAFSRAGAQILSLLTGDEYFPGGMGEFYAPKNEFLVFEEGPTIDVTLQWAKYFDASDQCSLSRIWGGIHTPIDDLYGREMGAAIAKKSFEFAKGYFNGVVVASENPIENDLRVYPNPSNGTVMISGASAGLVSNARIVDAVGRSMRASDYIEDDTVNHTELNLTALVSGFYYLVIPGKKSVPILLK